MKTAEHITQCADCFNAIYADDDAAHVCIPCGGCNRRLYADPPDKRWLGLLFIGVFFVALFALRSCK